MRARRSMKSQAGFTLAETLLAVLILLLVGVIVATGMPAVQNAYDKVVVAANAQALLSTATEALRDELGSAWSVDLQPDGTIEYYSADTGARSILFSDSEKGVLVTDYVMNAGFNDDETKLSYLESGRPLVSKEAANGNLTVKYSEAAYKTTTSGDTTTTDRTIITMNLEVCKGKKEMIRVTGLEIPILAPKPTPTPTPAPTPVP